jgi:hemolysin D
LTAALKDAAAALEALAADETSDRTAALLMVAQHLDTLCTRASADRLQTLTAPVDGAIQQLAVHTEGGVATPEQLLMSESSCSTWRGVL